MFGHGLAEQIGDQLQAGFVLAGFHEDGQPVPRFLIDGFVPAFIATCAIRSDLGLGRGWPDVLFGLETRTAPERPM